MLLKYLTTKMKIILCIFLLCITVSVFGQSQELNGIEEKSIEFPAAVKIDGSLMYGGKVIGRVLGGELLPLTTPEYQGRVQWDKSTGLFSLSRLRLEDSGVYTVESDGLKSVSTFSLTVWVPVSKPHLNVTRNESRCTVLCAAARGTRVTLTLYKNSEKNPYVTSPGHSHPHLNMTVPVESGTYTCEANNSVSRETSDPLTVGTHCTAPSVPVSKPHVRVTHDEYPCTLLCTVERGTGATLTLYKNSEKKPYVTSPVRSHPDLDMTVPVESGTYTCEAKNSVSRQTSDPLTVGAHCTAPSSLSTGTIVGIIFAVVLVALIALIAGLLCFLRHGIRRKDPHVMNFLQRMHTPQNVMNLLQPMLTHSDVPPDESRGLSKGNDEL